MSDGAGLRAPWLWPAAGPAARRRASPPGLGRGTRAADRPPRGRGRRPAGTRRVAAAAVGRVGPWWMRCSTRWSGCSMSSRWNARTSPGTRSAAGWRWRPPGRAGRPRSRRCPRWGSGAATARHAAPAPSPRPWSSAGPGCSRWPRRCPAAPQAGPVPGLGRRAGHQLPSDGPDPARAARPAGRASTDRRGTRPGAARLIIQNDRAKQELGWRPRPAETTIVETAESLRDLGLLQKR